MKFVAQVSRSPAAIQVGTCRDAMADSSANVEAVSLGRGAGRCRGAMVETRGNVPTGEIIWSEA